jgi:hypothetical protein
MHELSLCVEEARALLSVTLVATTRSTVLEPQQSLIANKGIGRDDICSRRA